MYAVPYAMGNDDAAAGEIPAGTTNADALASGTTSSSAMAPPPTTAPATTCPTRNGPPFWSSAPSSSTAPQNSPPGVNGSAGFSWYRLRTSRQSAKLSEAQMTRTRMPRGGTRPGGGTSSTPSTPPSARDFVGSPHSRHTSARMPPARLALTRAGAGSLWYF